MKLYDLELSGNCYTIRLFLNLIQQPVELVQVNVLKGEQQTPEFLAINPRAQIPALQDGDFGLGDSQAILVYLAEKFARDDWYPSGAETRARIQFWLSIAANEIAHGLADARLAKLFGLAFDYDRAVQTAELSLRLLERHLNQHDWLVGDRATIADLAVFPYVALAGDAHISLNPYPAVRAWINRIYDLPNFVGMPGQIAAEQTV